MRRIRAAFYRACPCGESDPACLDFHHKDPSLKVAPISDMITNCVSTEAFLAELSKCVCICSNCHRKHEAEKRGYRTADYTLKTEFESESFDHESEVEE